MTSAAVSDRQALERYATTRDPRLREHLVERYLPMARHVARRYARGSEPIDDLVQIASLGLLKAIDRFDPGKGMAFSSYAIPTMSGEVRRYFRDRTWAVRPPRDLQERSLAVERMTDRLTESLGRSPTVLEVADHLGIGEEAILEAREATRARGATSLSAPARGADGEDRTLGDVLGTDDDALDGVERRTTLNALQRALSTRQRRILHLRFDQDLTQAEIGRLVGLSQMQVSRILRDTLHQLRATAARDRLQRGAFSA